jgi:hypothetical protein
MYIYKIGYGSYEDSEFDWYTNKTKFTKDALNKMVAESIAYKISKSNFRKLSKYDLHFDNFVTDGDICKYLEKNFKFKKIIPETTCYMFGWTSALDQEDWKNQTDNNTKEIQKYIRMYLTPDISDRIVKLTKKKEELEHKAFERKNEKA